MKNKTCLAIGLNLVLVLMLTGCVTFGDLTPEQRTAKAQAFKELVALVVDEPIVGGEAAAFYIDKREEVDKVLSDFDRGWLAFQILFTPTAREVRAVNDARAVIQDVLDTIDGFIETPELEPL